MEITGGCLCGAVRYTSTKAPVVTRACWCRLCQYIGAGSGTVNAGFATDSFTITGELGDYKSVADSGNHMHRRFCPKCGTHLFSEAESRPQLIMVRVGTLDDPNAYPPSMTLWTKAAPAWACIDPTLTKYEGQSPPPKV